MASFQNKTVLVAPLDWGLGHATRCIPIIEGLLKYSCKVIIAATGSQKKLLQQEFPMLMFIDIPNYNVQYGKSRWHTILKIFGQLGKITSIIKKENKWLADVVSKHSIDIVLSDNRYGLYHNNCKTVFITHQLKPKSILNGLGENFVQKKLYRYINKFNVCWVVDNEKEPNLAGTLSHPTRLPNVPITYIGTITRFKKLEQSIQYDVCILLSGPEPQRTILETKLLKQIENTTDKICLVRGMPIEENPISCTNKNVKIYAHLDAEQLNGLCLQSNYIIARSGYSSIMDLFFLNKKCIFIPTPAQTEQEYLANYLAQKKYCLHFEQSKFDYSNAINIAKNFEFAYFEVSQQDELSKAIENLLIST